MASVFAALVSGLLFGLGLTVSQMVNPAKVIAFIDVFGDFDPSLAFVMATAIPVTAIGYALAARRHSPICAPGFSLPARRQVDRPLVLGAVLFGVRLGDWSAIALARRSPRLVSVILRPSSLFLRCSSGWAVILFCRRSSARSTPEGPRADQPRHDRTSSFNSPIRSCTCGAALKHLLDGDVHPRQPEPTAKIRLRTSCRSRATKVQSPRISSVGSRRSGTITVIMPAEDADRTPL